MAVTFPAPLNLYLPLTGGTLTGALAGTTASFTDYYGGGTTSAFPRWKRNGAAWNARLGDDSAYTGVVADNFQAESGSYRGASATILTLAPDGVAKLTNGAATAGAVLDVSTDSIVKLRNRANNADAAITASSGSFSTTLATAAPAGSSAGLWKFGALQAGAVVLDTTRSIFIDIGGTVYKLMVAQ